MERDGGRHRRQRAEVILDDAHGILRKRGAVVALSVKCDDRIPRTRGTHGRG